MGILLVHLLPGIHKEKKKDEDIQKDLNKIEYYESELPMIFNIHVPPKGVGLDLAVSLDKNLKPIIGSGGAKMINVGSKSVFNHIKKMQPSLGLFGHIHESKGITKIGKTLCINPGSTYEQGILQGIICNVKNKKIISWQFTEG